MISGEAIKAKAKTLGFDLCGIAPASALPELTHLREWLDRGYAGEMAYLHRSAETRADIRNFLPTAQSVIVTGTVYYVKGGGVVARPADGGRDFSPAVSPPSDPRTGGTEVPPSLVAPSVPAHIARYAWGEDYHIVLAERLEALVAWMREAHGNAFDAAIFVDKHHVQERVFAKHAGIGWVGKNTCVISPELGSWILLAGVAVSLALPADALVTDHCGACTLCLDACPTGALVDAHELDATRCISYLTIELNGPIPESQRHAIGDHVFGCDICQDVCPWNLAPTPTSDPAWQPRAGRDMPVAAELWQRSDFDLHRFVQQSAMTRTTMSRLRRNLAVAIGNTGASSDEVVLDSAGAGKPRAALSARTPLVQEHVAWAKAALERRKLKAESDSA